MARRTLNHTQSKLNRSSSLWQRTSRRQEGGRSQEFILDRNYIIDLVNSLESISER